MYLKLLTICRYGQHGAPLRGEADLHAAAIAAEAGPDQEWQRHIGLSKGKYKIEQVDRLIHR